MKDLHLLSDIDVSKKIYSLEHRVKDLKDGTENLEALTERSEAAAVSAGEDAEQTALDRVATGEDRSVVVTARNEAVAAKDLAVPAAEEATEARDGVISAAAQVAADKVVVMNERAAIEGVADEIFETFSLADGLGTYNASANSATLKEAGTTFTPTSTANQANGKYFDIVVAGTQNITGTGPTGMSVGGKLISRGTKWDYIPPGVGDGTITNPKLETTLKSQVENAPGLVWSGAPIAFDFTARTVVIRDGRWTLRKDYYSPLLTKNGGSGAEVATINMVISGSASGLNFLFAHLPTSTYYCVVSSGLSGVPADATLICTWTDATGIKMSYPYTRAEIDAKILVNTNSISNTVSNGLFANIGVDSWLYGFLLDIKFYGNEISVPSGQVVHLCNVWRNVTNVGQQWIIDIAINDTRFCQFIATSYSEPAADSNGNRFDTITLAPFSGSGISAIAKVNWTVATAGTAFAFTGGANRLKAILATAAYNRRLTGQDGLKKLTLPSTASPDRVYTVLNDIDSRNIVVSAGPLRQDLVRQYSLFLYVDKFLKNFSLNTDVRFSESGTDKIHLTSPRKQDKDSPTNHATPSVTVAKSIVISGGLSYNDKTVTFNQMSTRESTGLSTLVKMLYIGDSTVESLQKEVGVPDGYAHASWGVVHEQFWKARIDYLLEQGYTTSQIQTDAISGSHDKYKYIGIGTVDGHSPDVYTLQYRGVTRYFTVKAEGRGSWSYYMYINKPRLFQRSQGLWDAIGCGNGTGTDYIASAAQVYQMDRTPWTPTSAVDTAAMRAWALSILSYTGTTLGDYVAKFQDIELDPVNPFYDKDSSQTIIDSSANTWHVKFSISKYLSRWRTMNDAGVRLSGGDGAIGTKVGGNLANYDVTLPTHIIMQSCQNDGNFAHFGKMAKAWADAVKAQYVTSTWGTVNIGLSVIDGSGTYFPKLYPEVDAYCFIDESQRNVHDDNLTRLLTEVTSVDANHIFPLCHTHIIPTAKSVIYRGANSPEFELTQNPKDAFFMPSRTSTGIKAHINSIGFRNVGIHTYNWIKYTLGL